MHLARETVLKLVVVANDEDLRFLAALIALHKLLCRVASGVGRTTAGMHHAGHSGPGATAQRNVGLRVTQVVQIGTAGIFGAVLKVAANLNALALGIPALVIVSGDEMCGDALAHRELINQVVKLIVHAGRGQQLSLVKPGLTVDPVAGVEDVLDATALKVVVGRVEHVKTRVLAAQMVVRGNAVDLLFAWLGLEFKAARREVHRGGHLEDASRMFGDQHAALFHLADGPLDCAGGDSHHAGKIGHGNRGAAELLANLRVHIDRGGHWLMHAALSIAHDGGIVQVQLRANSPV